MTTITEPSYSRERWFLLLKTACAQYGVNKVAGRLGYSNHTSTSLVLAGKYPGGTRRYAARVLKAFDVVNCPHSGLSIAQEQCRETALARPPLNNPMKMQQWRACQQCPHKPTEVRDGNPNHEK